MRLLFTSRKESQYRLLKALFVLFGVLWISHALVGEAFSQNTQGTATGSAEVNQRLVRAGGSFRVTLRVKVEESVRALEPEFPEVDGLTLINPRARTKVEMKVIGNKTEATYEFVAAYRADKPGKYELGPFQVSYVSDSGNSNKLTIDPVQVEVFEDAPRPASDIIYSALPQLWKYLLGALLLTAFAFLLRWWLLRQKRAGPIKVSTILAPHKSPEQLAAEEIRALPRPLASDITAVKEYFDKVDDILRTYLSRRYGTASDGYTSWEIQQELHRQRKMDKRAKEVFSIINDCDWVKFAKSEPSQKHIDLIPDRVEQALLGISREEEKSSA